jgi:hypothetical protein
MSSNPVSLQNSASSVSAAGSIVAYALEITLVDPLQHGLKGFHICRHKVALRPLLTFKLVFACYHYFQSNSCPSREDTC